MTKSEKRYIDKVTSLGCVVCRNLSYGKSPAEAHHIRTGFGLERAPNQLIIPLCPTHHRLGGIGVAFHAGQKSFESIYGTELNLLAQTISEVFENA